MSVFLGILSTVALVLLIILGVALLLLSFVFFSRIRIFLRYREKLEILLQLWFVKINITKLISRPKRAKKVRKIHFTGELFGQFPEKSGKMKKSKKQTGHKNGDREYASSKVKKKKSVGEILELIQSIFSDISSPLAKCIDVKIHRLYVTAASKEAADTAIMFGHMNTAIGSLILACKKFRSLDIDEKNTGVYSDFNLEKPSLDAEIELIFWARHISVTGVKALMSYLKYNKK